MPRIRTVEIYDNHYTAEEISEMSHENIKMMCSFIPTESDLRFIQNSTSNGLSKIYIDNLINSVF